jgi:hypothetical protein
VHHTLLSDCVHSVAIKACMMQQSRLQHTMPTSLLKPYLYA